MRQAIEYEIIQNPALGAAAIIQAVVEYHNLCNEGMPLTLAMAILPIVFHGKTSELISRMNMVGAGLRKVRSEEGTIIVGLQRRMEGMVDLTFRAINIAISCNKCLSLHSNGSIEIIPQRKTICAQDFGYTEGDAVEIISAAKRVGHWFATFKLLDICQMLNLRF